LGRALDQVLRFLQAEARDLANDFDDIDLVAAHFGQRRRELGLLLGGSCCAAAGYCHGHGRRRRHAELLLELLHELRELEDGDSLDVVDYFLLTECHSIAPDDESYCCLLTTIPISSSPPAPARSADRAARRSTRSPAG